MRQDRRAPPGAVFLSQRLPWRSWLVLRLAGDMGEARRKPCAGNSPSRGGEKSDFCWLLPASSFFALLSSLGRCCRSQDPHGARWVKMRREPCRREGLRHHREREDPYVMTAGMDTLLLGRVGWQPSLGACSRADLARAKSYTPVTPCLLCLQCSPEHGYWEQLHPPSCSGPNPPVNSVDLL